MAREDERWRVFSGLEGEEEEEEEEEEEVEDGVREEEETMLEGPGTLPDAPSVATETWEREGGDRVKQQSKSLSEVN